MRWDQGSELQATDQLAELFVDDVFLTYPGWPWERPLHENTNGLLAVLVELTEAAVSEA